MIPIGYLIASDDYEASKFALETLKAENGTLQTQIGQFEIAHENLVKQRDTVMKQRDEANEALAKAVVVNRELSAQLQKESTPAPQQKITRAVLPRIYGFTIEKSKESPSSALYLKVRTAMKWGASMGFTHWRGFFNVQEVAEHLKSAPVNGNLIAYGQSLGLRFIADTIDAIALKLADDVAFKLYLDGLTRLGCEGVYINDANRAELPLETLKSIVARIRKLAPEMPVFASLLATANLATYKAIVDHVEIQTFGTPAELERFLAVDDKLAYSVIMCLDTRTPMTALDLARRAAIILKNPPNAFFYYADLPGDYEAQPDEEDVIIRGLVALLKARP